jgi:hypothetical protein
VIFHTFALWDALSEKYWSQEVASDKLEKGPLIDSIHNCFLFICGTYGSGEEEF